MSIPADFKGPFEALGTRVIDADCYEVANCMIEPPEYAPDAQWDEACERGAVMANYVAEAMNAKWRDEQEGEK